MRSACMLIVGNPKQQQGVILLSVVVVMFATMLLASALVNHYSVTEAQAIERSLAEVRAHWSQIGHFDYGLSRARYEGEQSTGFANHIAKSTALLGYLNEPSVRFFDYSDLLTGTYQIEVQAAVIDKGEGKMEVRLTQVSAAGVIPALIDIEKQKTVLVANVCMGSDLVGVRTPTGGCGLGTGNNGISSVTSMVFEQP